MYVSGRFTHSFQIFAGHGERCRHSAPRPLGAPQGDHARRYRRFHAPRLAGRTFAGARTGGRGTVPHQKRGAPCRRMRTRGIAAFRAFGRDQLYLQAGRKSPQGAQRHSAALARRRRTPGVQTGNDRQHPFGRAADPRAFVQRPARDHPRRLSRRGVYSRAHLDAAFFPCSAPFRGSTPWKSVSATSLRTFTRWKRAFRPIRS